jgi:hypothetical protein
MCAILPFTHIFKEIDVRPRLTFRLTILMLLTFGFPTFAQQFSAEMVRTKPAGAPASKVSVREDKMRFEMTGAQPQQGSLVVMDLTHETGFMALPGNKTYTMLPPGRLSTSMPFFRATDSEKACPAWEKLVGKPGSCSKVGDETLNGRETVKYRGVARNGDTGYVWVDRKLNFVTKWEGDRGAVEFQNIEESPQAASMFEVPTGYEKMDSQAEHRAALQSKNKTKAVPKPLPQN